MKKGMRFIILIVATLLAYDGMASDEKEYRPGGSNFASIWDRFYSGEHEPELDDPLIEAGSKMTLIITEAVSNKDMKLRRYAIGALGFIGDIKALPTLERILNDKSEIYYFRGDALHAIYKIDQGLGRKYAKIYANDHEYLLDLAKSIKLDEKWLTEPTEH